MYKQRKFASIALRQTQITATIAPMRRSIGEVVRERRKSLGLTLDQVCSKMTDYDAGNLSRFEKGQQRIVEEKLDEIAAALGTTSWELFQARDPDPSTPTIFSERRAESRPTWPFKTSLERYERLPDIDKIRCATYIEATVDAFESSGTGNGTVGP